MINLRKYHLHTEDIRRDLKRCELRTLGHLHTAYMREVILFPRISDAANAVEEVYRALCYGVNIFTDEAVNTCMVIKGDHVQHLHDKVSRMAPPNTQPMKKVHPEVHYNHIRQFMQFSGFTISKTNHLIKYMVIDDVQAKLELVALSFEGQMLTTVAVTESLGKLNIDNNLIDKLEIGADSNQFFIHEIGDIKVVLPQFMRKAL